MRLETVETLPLVESPTHPFHFTNNRPPSIACIVPSSPHPPVPAFSHDLATRHLHQQQMPAFAAPLLIHPRSPYTHALHSSRLTHSPSPASLAKPHEQRAVVQSKLPPIPLVTHDTSVPPAPLSTPLEAPAQPPPSHSSSSRRDVIGVELLRQDVAAITNFFQSIRNPLHIPAETEKSPPPSPQHPHPHPDTYTPKSATAKTVASKYAAARGAVHRACQTLSIHAQTSLGNAYQLAGRVVLTVLTASHAKLSHLNFRNPNIPTGRALPTSWTPLQSFEWQLAASSDDDLRARRRLRVHHVNHLISGASLDGLVRTAGSFFIVTGKAVERFLPTVVHRFTTANSKHADIFSSRQALSLPLPVFQFNISNHLQFPGGASRRQRKNPHRSKNALLQSLAPQTPIVPQTIRKLSMAAGQKAHTSHMLSSPALQRAETAGTRNRHNAAHSATSSHDIQVEGVARNTSDTNLSALRAGVLLMGATALTSVALGTTFPAVVTGSTLMLATMAVSEAKAVPLAEVNDLARHRFRRSHSIRNVEDAFARAETAMRSPRLASRAIGPAVDRVARSLTSGMENSTGRDFAGLHSQPAVNNVVETTVRSVSKTTPYIMSIPVIGCVLYWLDVAAFHVEKVGATVVRRTGLRHSVAREADWTLLRSFEKL